MKYFSYEIENYENNYMQNRVLTIRIHMKFDKYCG